MISRLVQNEGIPIDAPTYRAYARALIRRRQVDTAESMLASRASELMSPHERYHYMLQMCVRFKARPTGPLPPAV